MPKGDYYEILGISHRATQEEIKRSFKKLAFQYHPDRNPGDSRAEEKFKKISEAYHVLGNPRRRGSYDRFGRTSDWGLFSEGGFGVGFEDFFESFFGEVFGTRPGRPKNKRGSDLKYSIEISFEEAAFGVEKEIAVPRRGLCKGCQGSGAASAGAILCDKCNGSGSVRFSKGFLALSRTCSSCGGSCRKTVKSCSTCGGDGVTVSDQLVKLRVPAGIIDGARLRIRGGGDSGLGGGQSGDLFIEVRVKEHPIFRRAGEDIFCEVSLSFVQATLGAETEVPVLKGFKKTIVIPAGTQPGQRLRIEGEGLPRLDGVERVDLYVILEVEVPVNLTPRQRKLLEEFDKAEDTREKPFVRKVLDGFQQLVSRPPYF